MKEWVIFGTGLPELHITAASFDEALEEARKENKDYYGGKVK